MVIGGLGGGGDVALALTLARAMGLRDDDIIVISFFNCSVAGGRFGEIAIEGSLISIPPGYFPSRRVFEDKLPLVAPGLRGRVYGICTRDPWHMMLRGLLSLIQRYKPACMIHADNGGDGVVLGYEERLGSFKTDTVARALLAEAAARGTRSLLAAGCVGCEGGGTALDEEWLAAGLYYAMRSGALLGVVEPPREAAREAELLLRHAESGMLPYYLAALRGARKARIEMAYLHGEFPVKPWHSLVFILDAARHCSISPLCKAARGRGVQALRNYRKRRSEPPRELREALNLVKRHGVSNIMSRLAKRRLSLEALRRLCLSNVER